MSNQTPVMQPNEYWFEYLKYDRAKTVDSVNYNLNGSLRIWFKNYEQQAFIHGVHTMNDCAPHIIKFMPKIIQQWIPTLPPTIRTNWELLKEQLLLRFGKPANEEQKSIMKTLSELRQDPNESIRLYAAKWEHQTSLLIERIDEERQMYLFLQSLAERDFRLALFTWIDTATPATLGQLIQKAIQMEEKANILRDPQATTRSNNMGSEPMDIDHMQRSANQQHHNSRNRRRYQQQSGANPGHNPSGIQQRRAYDKDGNPICDFCSVTPNGTMTNPDKIKSVLKYPPPTNVNEVEQFLGMAGVYHKFISQYQLLVEPLRRLKSKSVEFSWSSEQQAAFDNLKKQLCLLPTLKTPDFHKQFELHTDAASKAGIAVILCQRYDGQPYPLAFSSRSLSKPEQNYSIQEMEALAVVWGIKKHRQYLERNHFLVYTDHSSLQWLLNTKEDRQPRLWRWAMLLQAYDFKVIYTPAYHPASNGAVERFMKTLRNMILTYTNNDIISDNWDQHLRIIQFVYNTTVNDTTQYTPFYLTHGRNPRTPLIVTQEGHFVDHYKSPSQQYAIDLQDRLNLAFDLVDQLKENTNQLNQVNPYKIGDLVLVFNHAHTTKNKPRKLAFDWYGPLIVTSLISKSSCNLKYQESSKILKNVHVSRMKKYHTITNST
ncbi:hypothetical protein [Absidia glauca]|uniref:Integrase catalytic domain-containing protein n=1 Tax=Absidia glauca TaxID=4829 RepID=A0A163JDM5_ABSGL|nr:hypothetical protein [Absidia glauca]